MATIPWVPVGLDAARAVAWRRALLVVTALAVMGWTVASRGGLDPAGRPLGTDFLSFWAAGRLALHGQADLAWTIAAHWAEQRRAFAGVGYAAFFYPPPFLLLCLPLASLPYFPALLLWLGATGAAYVAVCRRWTGELPGATPTVLAFPAVLLNLGHGQNGFLTAALMGGGLLAMRRGRPWLAGLMLGSLVVKPHLALLLPPALVIRREWRTMIATAAVALGWCATSALVLGMGAWRGFLAASALARATLEQGYVAPAKMVSLFAAARVADGSVAGGYALQILGGLAALAAIMVLARRDAPPPAQDAALVAATLVASPFLLDYDLTLMALPLAWLWRRGIDHVFRRGEREALAALFAAPFLLRPLATAWSLPLGPLVLAALLALVVTAARAEGAVTPSPCRR